MCSLYLTNNTLRDKTPGSYPKKIFPRWFRKSVFKAEIINKRPSYIRGTLSITFRSEYIGKLKHGYFMNKIILPQNNKMNRFSETILHLSPDGQTVRSFCEETMESIAERKDNLNG